MFDTAKTAKFKYCPFLVTGEGKFRTCQTLQCMMWRFKGNTGEAALRGPEEKPGYCGLAGIPVT